MIGSITTSDGRQATLDDDGIWQSDNASMAAFLNAVHSPLKPTEEDEQVSRALPFWGRDQLQSAADFYGTAPVFQEYKNDPDQEVIY